MSDPVILQQPLEKLGVRICAIHGNHVIRMAHALYDQAHPFHNLTPTIMPRIPGASRHSRVDDRNHLAAYDFARVDPRDLAQALDDEVLEHPQQAGLTAKNPLLAAGDFERSLYRASLRLTPVQCVVLNDRANGPRLSQHDDFVQATRATITTITDQSAPAVVMLCRGDGPAGHGFALRRLG